MLDCIELAAIKIAPFSQKPLPRRLLFFCHRGHVEDYHVQNLVTTVVCTAVAACFSFHSLSTSAQTPAEPLKIGFVYVAPLTEAGWVRQHEEGRKAVDAALGARVKTTFVENVPEGPDAERVIRDLAQQGHKLIFTPSFGYMEPTLKVAAEFPDVKFESITGYKTAANVAVANARYYEGPLPSRCGSGACHAKPCGRLRGGFSDS